MHFSVKALDYDYLYDYVDYYYINNDFTNIEIYSRNYHVANFKKSTYNTEGFQTYRTVYFTIKKQKSQFYSTSGDYRKNFFLNKKLKKLKNKKKKIDLKD